MKVYFKVFLYFTHFFSVCSSKLGLRRERKELSSHTLWQVMKEEITELLPQSQQNTFSPRIPPTFPNQIIPSQEHESCLLCGFVSSHPL